MSRTIIQRLSAERKHEVEGSVYLYAEYDLHPDLSSLTVSYPEYLSIETTNGFSKSQKQQCEWDSSTDDPWIQFLVDVDRTNGRGYEFADAGNWAVFKYPPFGHSWKYSGQNIDLTNEYDVRDEGIISSDGSVAYLGTYNEFSDCTSDQTFRIAVPQQASIQASSSEVLSSLCHASENLRVGGKNEEVIVVVVPSSFNWGWEGLQSGANGYWVVDSNRVNDVHNTWVHEYVHTRQEWERDESTRWLVEGTTEYYAALLTLQQNRIPFSAFYRHVTTSRDSDSVLVDPDRWTSPRAYYTKGRRVTAALDVKIRRETDGQSTFEDVFRQMNSLEDPLTHDRLQEIIADVVGSPLDSWLGKYVKGSQTPSIPEDESLFVEDVVSEPEDGPENETEETGPEVEETGPTGAEDCPVCGESVSADQEFCDSCGTALHQQCPVCGRGVTDEPYCPECGTAIQDECDICGYRRHHSEEFCSNCGTRF